jgi:Pentapeptide repeats (8 copies)
MTERPITPSRPLANILDRLLEPAMRKKAPSFYELAIAAGLDPACDFVAASLRDIDFRDEDLRGFDFSKADLTGADVRRAKVEGVRFEEAMLNGAIGLADRSVQQHVTSKPAVFLAEVTDDLQTHREQLRRYLQQFDIEVLPRASRFPSFFEGAWQ